MTVSNYPKLNGVKQFCQFGDKIVSVHNVQSVGDEQTNSTVFTCFLPFFKAVETVEVEVFDETGTFSASINNEL